MIFVIPYVSYKQISAPPDEIHRLCLSLNGKNMKETVFIALICLSMSLIAGCGNNDNIQDERSSYKPVLMDRSQLNNSIAFFGSKDIRNPGEVRTYASLLLIVEKYEGVHIYDNSNALSPVEKGFLNIPGCLDIVLNNNVLYASNATDLVSIDLSIPGSPKIVNRIPNVFPELNAPDGYDLYPFLKNNRPANTVVVNWIKIKS